MRTILSICFLLLLSVSFSQRVELAGQWRFAIDRNNSGISEKWFEKSLTETIKLPGSMAESGKGDDITINTKWTGSIYDSSFFFRPTLAKYRTPDNLKIPFWLTPTKHYVGAAWYQRDIIIPANWNNKSIRIYFERCHTKTIAWIDDKEIGRSNSLSAPHVYEVENLAPGKHTISVRIDNSIEDMNVGPDSHSVSDHTQGNWNGIIGNMYMEVIKPVNIADIQIFPDIKSKSATVKMKLVNRNSVAKQVKVILQARSFNSEIVHLPSSVTRTLSLRKSDTTVVELKLSLGTKAQLWDEFTPALYDLVATVISSNEKDTKHQQFGMREFKISGRQFIVNGNLVFLRGTLSNCEFPLTGYPAMDEAAWVRIFKTAKAHGLNHFRFHSWCPPEAAFIAADKVGFYLQPEAPTWPNHGTSVGDGRFIDQYIYEETNRMVTTYGNYASFCMLAAGNEPAGKNQAKYLAEFVNYWKARDSRRVYTGASVAMSWPLVPENEFMVKSGPRGLKWTNIQPENTSNYFDAVKGFTVPYVTHEMGQWCVFPNFEEIKKYSGVYKARNFELFQENLEDHGMAKQAKEFLLASGKLQALCYKAEIEKDLRTPGLAGFQLLGLQDFPGQGTALIGVLDAFWDSKPYINARQFSRFCNATVPLAKMEKFVFTNDEILDVAVELFHFGKNELTNTVFTWTIKSDAGETVRSGAFSSRTYPKGNNIPIGDIKLSLSEFLLPSHIKLEIGINNTSIVNDWDFWVYPKVLARAQPSEVYFCSSFDSTAEAILRNGGKVFLQAPGKIVKGQEIVMHFTPAFWNTSWFKMRPPHTIGLLIKNEHPLFANFPTSYHSDYQWWSIVNGAQVMHLEDFPEGFESIVQPIDTWFMNRKLGLIFEAKVGAGKLLVCSADISFHSSNPANRQLYYSVYNYIRSDQFNPIQVVDAAKIKDLFVSPSKETWDSFTKASPDELKPGNKKTD